MHPLIDIAGGVALILFGARFVTKGLDRLVGARLGHWIQRLAGSTPKAAGAGAALAALAPSSTTITILAAQNVRSGHLSPRQAMALLLGAGVGLTVMVQLIALDVYHFAPLLIAAGVGLFMFTRKETSRGIGQVSLAVGFIFLAIGLIKAGAAAAAASGDAQELLAIATRHPWMLLVLGAVITVALQSSTATLGLMIGLLAAGSIEGGLTAPFVLGVNLGLSITTLIVAWTQTETRRMALGLLLLRGAVIFVLMFLLEPLSQLVARAPGSDATRLAHLHSAFNVAAAVIGLPLVGSLYRLAGLVSPAAPAEPAPFGPRHISKLPVEATGLAMAQSMREILDVSQIVRSMVDDAWKALKEDDEALARVVAERDDRVDLLDGAIKQFLVRLGAGDTGGSEAREQMLQLRYLNELETIGDVVEKNLIPLVFKKIALKATFSDEGWRDLDEFCEKVRENLVIADTVFMKRDRAMARQLIRHKERLGDDERRFRDRHFARLRMGLAQSHETTAIHLDLLTHLKRVNSCATRVAFEILDNGRGSEGAL